MTLPRDALFSFAFGMQLAAEAFQIISGVTHGLLLDPAARIFEWLWTKISTVSPLESSMQPRKTPSRRRTGLGRCSVIPGAENLQSCP
jgi:hypothetical protein